jgi:hypothetical protein
MQKRREGELDANRNKLVKRQKLTQRNEKTIPFVSLPKKLESQNMKKLPATDIPHHGHTLAIIERTETLGLFRSTWKQDTTPGFIVAKITQSPAAVRIMPDGKEVAYSARETLPSEAEYGRNAWFFRSQDAARIKFEQVRDAQTARLTVKAMSGQGQDAIPA